MNPVLVAALVAGIVSLAGVLANLYIAGQARRTTLLQMKMQVLATHASQSSQLIKTLITETERVRISCWNLLGHLHQLQRESADDAAASCKVLSALGTPEHPRSI